MSADAWDDPCTAAAYVAFTRRHDRYRRVSRALAAGLTLPEAARVLDVAAGTGVTSRAVLDAHPTAQIVAMEPSAAMRDASTLRRRRVRWTPTMPEGTFDAVLCSAAVWLLGPGTDGLARLAARVAPGGTLAFTIPAAFVGLPDGDRRDRPAPLDALTAAFLRRRAQAPAPGAPPPDHRSVRAFLEGVGFDVKVGEVAVRWTLALQRDWLALPPVGLAMRPDLTPEALAPAVADATTHVGRRRGPRTERWSLWWARR